jgi:hypothetical protein
MATMCDELATETRPRTWVAWPVYWSGVWVGALSALCALLIFGLAATAFGMHLVSKQEINHWSRFNIGVVIFSVIASFLAFAIGGWVAAKIAGILHSEPAMLHGAIAWLVAVPILLALATHGAANYFGGWYTGLAGPEPIPLTTVDRPLTSSTVTAYDVELERARQARNSALGAVTALLLGLMGSVVGGWMASGEPMTFTHYRTRNGRMMTSTTTAHSRL